MNGSLQRKCIIALDPSINDTGVAVLINGALVFSGVIRPAGVSLSERLGSLMTEVGKLFDHYSPSHCSIEIASSFSYRRSQHSLNGKGLNAKDIMKNGYATAVILGVAGSRQGVKVTEFAAHEWKLVAGKNMNKDDMISFARSLSPELQKIKRLSSHEAEAVCMAHLS